MMLSSNLVYATQSTAPDWVLTVEGRDEGKSDDEINEDINAKEYTCVYGDTERIIRVKTPEELPVASLQIFLDEYLKENDGELDYIHGIDSTQKLCQAENTVGFIFEGMGKSQLFSAVEKDGSLPRKTFSMGHADDKRFYIEARKIK